MRSLLIIEDDPEIQAFLARGLKGEGYGTTPAGTVADGLAKARAERFDAIILDLMLPDDPGQDVCEGLRAEGDTTPILVLTALDALEDKVRGLRAGADDYLCKPFEFEELLVRIEALIRRGSGLAQTEPIRQVADLTLDPDRVQVHRGGREIRLTAKEFKLLSLLMSQPDKVFSRESILEAVWGQTEDISTNVLEVCVRRLRRKIDPEGQPALIQTLRHIGYKITEPRP